MASSLHEIIRAAGGAIPFREYMNIVLYGDDGFYTRRGEAGRRGDFITSPEVGPLFAAVLARALDAWWKEMGSPSSFTVMEVGAGPGTLARGLIAAQPECSKVWTYVAVEISEQQRAKHPSEVISLAEMPEGKFTGIVIANELLDNLAFDLRVFDQEWRESWIGVNGDQLVEILKPLTEPSLFLPAFAKHGARAPLQREAQEWIRNALQKLDSGRVLVFDYCTPLTAMAAAQPWREWLRTYVGHEKGQHYLQIPGRQDITTQVMIDQLAAVKSPESVRSQSQFLQLWGIDELVAEGKAAWEAAAAAPNVAAIKMRSRISESAALLDPNGLGSFTALTFTP
ncbi:SAM-dependent methyltransferase [bacterium]|nr:SAM-dependent methyltransferase [bacterium]